MEFHGANHAQERIEVVKRFNHHSIRSYKFLRALNHHGFLAWR